MFLPERLPVVGNGPQPSKARELATLCTLMASLVSGCVQTKETDASGYSQSLTETAKDTGVKEEQKDTGLDSTGNDPQDSEGSGDSGATDDTGDTQDTSETTEPECMPQNTSAWPSAWSVEVGSSFRDLGGSELSDISGIPGASVDLDPQVIYGVGDNGYFYEMDGQFTLLRSYAQTRAEDNEGVAADPASGSFFTVDEDTSDVDEYTWPAGADPVKSSTTDCTLNIPADPTNNWGIEGFTFLPADEAPPDWQSESWVDSRGYLLAGSQTDSNVGVFPLGLCTADAVLDPVLSLPTSNTDISGLATLKGNLYVLHDSANTVDVVDLSTQVTQSTYSLPTSGQEEGIWVRLRDCDDVQGYATMYIADDVRGEIYGYDIPVNSAY